MATDRRREPWSFNKIILWTSKTIKDLASSPTITAGSGAPTAAEPKGSAYLRTGGSSANDVLYVATDALGTWEALQGDNDFGAGGIKADIVTESTGGAGVTIPDGVELRIGTGSDLYWLSDGTNVDGIASGAYDITAGSYSVTDGTATISLDGAGAISIDDGTGSLDLDGAGALSTTGLTTIDLDGSGAINIESSGGAIRVGGDNVAQDIGIGTSGARDIYVGSAAAGSVTIDAGVGILSMAGAGVTVPDGVELRIGTGSDYYWISDGTDVDAIASGAVDTTLADSSTYQVSGNAAGNLILTLDAVNAGAGEGQLSLNADDQVTLSDGVGSLDIDGGVVALTDGVGTINLDGAGALSLTAVTTIDLDGSGAINIESSAGAIRVGGDNVAQDIGIGTSGARDIYIGSTAAGSVSIDAGVGILSMAADAYVDIDAGAYLILEETPQRLRGFRRLSDRYELTWVAGEDGLVALNASAAYTVSRHFELQGTNASDDDCTFYAEGGLLIETDGADGDEVIIFPHQDAAITPWDDVTWGTDQEVSWECEISTAPLIATQIIWAGLKLTNTEVKATDADQVYFRYEDDVAAGNLEVVYTNTADGLVSVDSGVTLAGDTRYHLKLVMQADRTVKCYVNGALVATTNALDDATDLKPVIGTAADGAGVAVSIVVHGQSISRNIGA